MRRPIWYFADFDERPHLRGKRSRSIRQTRTPLHIRKSIVTRVKFFGLKKKSTPQRPPPRLRKEENINTYYNIVLCSVSTLDKTPNQLGLFGLNHFLFIYGFSFFFWRNLIDFRPPLKGHTYTPCVQSQPFVLYGAVDNRSRFFRSDRATRTSI